MQSVREGRRIRPVNEVRINDAWVTQTYGPSNLRADVLREGEDFDVYRLVIPDSATAYVAGGQNICIEFRKLLTTPRPPVVGYRGIPSWDGPVALALQYAYEVAGHMERHGLAWDPAKAQQVMDILSGTYGNVEGALRFEGAHMVYPYSSRFDMDGVNWR